VALDGRQRDSPPRNCALGPDISRATSGSRLDTDGCWFIWDPDAVLWSASRHAERCPSHVWNPVHRPRLQPKAVRGLNRAWNLYRVQRVDTSEFNYHLPTRFIAQKPVEPRDSARLLVLHRDTDQVEHRTFRQIGDYLETGDVLVLNRTRVIPARLWARKTTGGRVELLLLRRIDASAWECLVGGSGVRLGTRLYVEGGPPAEVVSEADASTRIVRFESPVNDFLSRAGHVPLPPYIHQSPDDPERYQTVYGDVPGSAAAPTAGLHFTPELLESLQRRGVEIAHLVLHVGLDTFLPVTESDPARHRIHREWCEVPRATVEAIRAARSLGRRVVAVGTTTARTLESAAERLGAGVAPPRRLVREYSGETSLFILPGYEFRVVDALVTNFHLPRSTLLMMVSAFAGRERVLRAYEIAQREEYRFYSFGDAMLIL